MKRRRNVLIWIGFAIVVVALVSYIPVFAVFPVTRDIPWANYLLFLIGGTLLAGGVRRAFRDPEHYRGKISGSVLAALSALLIGFFVWGVTYFTRQIPSGATAVAVNQKAPAFVLRDVVGKQVSSASLLMDHRGVLLVFLSGVLVTVL